ncbi:hypothetical protein ACFYO2_36395 [Streptomyces sp. NPDC006602]
MDTAPPAHPAGTSMAVSGYIIGLAVIALLSTKVLADRARSR